MKVLLMNAPKYFDRKKFRYLDPVPIPTYTPPMGLTYIAACLLQDGHDVKIVDAYNSEWDEVEEEVKKYAPQIVGITVLSDQRLTSFKLARLVKSIDPAIKVVLGGTHVTLLWEQVAAKPEVDVAVLGEGEATMCDLVKAFEGNKSLENVNGIAFEMDGRVVKTPPRELIYDLDSLPLPAYHLVDLDMYKGWNLITEVARVMDFPDPHSLRVASIVTSRGCPGTCGFCSVNKVWGKKWRSRSPKNVVDEIEILSKEYGVKVVIMHDDNFTVDKKRVIEICREIIRRKISIYWGCETGVKYVSPELLEVAAESGCVFITYGVESGSDVVLRNVSKRLKRDEVVRAFEITKQAGILAGAFMMVGNPGESSESIRQTIELLRDIQPDIIIPQVAMLFPGTDIFDLAKSKGFITDEYWEHEDLPVPYYAAEQPLRKLFRWHRMMQYYNQNQAWRFLKTIRDFIELRTGIRVTHGGILMAPPAPRSML